MKWPTDAIGRCGLAVLVALAAGGCHRIEDAYGEHAHEEGHDDPRAQELPDRHASGPHDGQLALAAELQERGDRADQHGKGDEELGVGRKTQDRDQRQRGQRDIALLA